jgi:hypothetical protein
LVFPDFAGNNRINIPVLVSIPHLSPNMDFGEVGVKPGFFVGKEVIGQHMNGICAGLNGGMSCVVS